MSEINRRSGIYRILQGGVEIGTEAWSQESAPNHIRLASVVMRAEPEPFEEEIELELDGDWRPLRLAIERSSSTGERRYVGRRVGDAWISQIFREIGPLKTVTLPFEQDSHVDYFSPHTNRVTIQRLGLGTGDSREIDALFIEPESYTPIIVRQEYSRLPDPTPEMIGGAMARSRHRYRGASGFESTILTDSEGVVLRYDGLFQLIEV